MPDSNVKEKSQDGNNKYKTVLELHEGKKILEHQINQLVSEFIEKLPSMVKLEEIVVGFSTVNTIDAKFSSRLPYTCVKLDIET